MAAMPKPTPAVDAEQAIRALAQEYAKYENAHETDKLLNLFTSDARSLGPFRPMAEGTNAIRQMMEQTYTEYDPRNLKTETIHVEVSGNLAVSVGTFTMDIRTPKGTRLNDRGKWIVTLRQVGSEWRIATHCWNTDLPLTTLAT